MTSAPSPLIVMDVPTPAGRRLVESSQAAGFEVHSVNSPAELKAALASGSIELALVAFDAIRPQPQAVLEELRRTCARATIVGVVDPDSPRARLAQRLWASGALNALVERTVAPTELGAAIRSAASSRAAGPSEPLAGDDAEQQLNVLSELSGAFAAERTIAGVLRALRLRLGRIQPFQVLQVFISTGPSFRVETVSRGAVPHAQLYDLVGAACAELTAELSRPIRPEDLDMAEPEVSLAEVSLATEWTPLVLPLPGHDGPIGCLGLLVPKGSVGARQRSMLKVVSQTLSAALRYTQKLEEAERARLEDALTGCRNRRFLTEALAAEWKRATRYNLQLSIAMVDVDHFKRLNDVFGHVAGDEVLKNFAGFLRKHFRETDSVVRYGGEEFVVLMPETGPAEAAMKVERIRILAASHTMHRAKDGTPVQVTFSAGIASHPASPVESADALIREADTALYTAKRTGRDRVCIAALPEGEPVDVTLAQQSGSGRELRGFPRVPVRMPVRLIELTDFETRMSQVIAGDISAGGIAITGRELTLKKDAWALVYLEDAQKPLLTRVVWSTQEQTGENRVGLRFVPITELAKVAQTRERVTTRTLVCVERPVTENMVLRVLHAAQHDITKLFPDSPVPQDLGAHSMFVLGEGVLRQRPDLLAEVPSHARVVVVNEGSGREQALETLVAHQVQHMVSLDQGTDEALFATLNKLLLGEYFGVRKYLLWGAKLKQWRLTDHGTKNDVLAALAAFAVEMNCHPRVADLLVMAVDEMIINAMYRAPQGEKLKPVFVECGSDGRLLAVSVLDEYGRFQSKDLYQGLAKARDRQLTGMPDEARNASLGFKIMLDALSHLAVNVDPGKRTEVIGIVDLRKTLKELRGGVPGVDLFEETKK